MGGAWGARDVSLCACACRAARALLERRETPASEPEPDPEPEPEAGRRADGEAEAEPEPARAGGGVGHGIGRWGESKSGFEFGDFANFAEPGADAGWGFCGLGHPARAPADAVAPNAAVVPSLTNASLGTATAKGPRGCARSESNSSEMTATPRDLEAEPLRAALRPLVASVPAAAGVRVFGPRADCEP